MFVTCNGFAPLTFFGTLNTLFELDAISLYDFIIPLIVDSANSHEAGWIPYARAYFAISALLNPS